MKVAPSVETIMTRFPKKNHQIDTITGKPERLALNIIIEVITKNAASVPTLEEFDCSRASIEQLYLCQDKIQNFAIGTSGAITDETWMLQTTHVIKLSGILNKAVIKWQAQTTAYKTKARFITNFNKEQKISFHV